MEAISLKLDEQMLKNIDQTLKEHNYSTRTEFIRDAIREKLEELRTEIILQKIDSFRGSAKIKTTRAQNKKVAEEVLREIAQERGWEL